MKDWIAIGLVIALTSNWINTLRGYMLIRQVKMAPRVIYAIVLGLVIQVAALNILGSVAPVLQPVSRQYVLEGDKLTIFLAASDADGDDISIGLISRPTGAVFVDNGDGTALFEWVPGFAGPNSADGSPFELKFRASDGQNSTVMTTEVIVINNNRRPYIVSPDTIVIQSGNNLGFEVYGYDPDYDLMEWSLIDRPEGLEFTFGEHGSAVWATTYADSGMHSALIELSDFYGAADTAEVVMNVLQTEVFALTIDTAGGYPSELVDIDINLMNLETVSGFNILINYDASVLTFASLTEVGSRVEDWEYFNYNLNENGVTGDIRLTGIADLDNGIVTSDLEIGDGNLASLAFVISGNLNYAGFAAPVIFVYRDIFVGDDNTLTDSDGERIDQDQMNFLNGYIRIRAASENGIGDLNLNGVSFEIGDAVYFTNYFVNPILYPMTPVQVLNSDVNRDGYGATIADLVFLINRLLNFEKGAGKKVRYNSDKVAISTNNTDGEFKLLYNSNIELGGIAVVLEASERIGTGLVLSSELEEKGMKLKYSVDGNLVRLLIYGDQGQKITTGHGELINIENNSDFIIKEIQLSTADGYVIESIFKNDLAGGLPEKFVLYQNYPNPFNPMTEIRFTLPKTAETGLTIHNILGQEIIKLVDGILDTGEHSVIWDGRDNHGQAVSSGIYFYRLDSDGFSDKKKMILLK